MMVSSARDPSTLHEIDLVTGEEHTSLWRGNGSARAGSCQSCGVEARARRTAHHSRSNYCVTFSGKVGRSPTLGPTDAHCGDR